MKPATKVGNYPEKLKKRRFTPRYQVQPEGYLERRNERRPAIALGGISNKATSMLLAQQLKKKEEETE